MKLNDKQKALAIKLLEEDDRQICFANQEWEMKRTEGIWGWEYHIFINGSQYWGLMEDEYKSIKDLDRYEKFKVGDKVKAIFDKYGKHPFIGTIYELDNFAHIRVEKWLDKPSRECFSVCIPKYDIEKVVE